MDLEQLQTDTTKEEEGVWLPFGDDAEVLIASWGNEKHTKALVKAEKRVAKQRELGLLTPEKEREINLGILADTIFLGFRGFRRGGKDLPYSRDAAFELLKQYRPLRTFVISESQALEHFLARKVEEVAENLSGGSAGRSEAEPQPGTSPAA